MIGLAMHLGLAAPLSFMVPQIAPHPPPLPPGAVVVATPSPRGASAGDGGEVLPQVPSAPAPAPTTTTTAPPSSSYSGLECVVTLSAPDGTTMTYSPAPAVNGVCSLGTPEPVAATW
jgi:hypothetical protein